MDYAVQLLVIIGLFTAVGLWIRDHWWHSPLAVVLMILLGFACGLIVLYQRGLQEGRAQAERDKLNPPPPPLSDSEYHALDLNTLLGNDEDDDDYSEFDKDDKV